MDSGELGEIQPHEWTVMLSALIVYRHMGLSPAEDILGGLARMAASSPGSVSTREEIPGAPPGDSGTLDLTPEEILRSLGIRWEE